MAKELKVGAEIKTANQTWKVEAHLRNDLYLCTIAARKEYPAGVSLVEYVEPKKEEKKGKDKK